VKEPDIDELSSERSETRVAQLGEPQPGRRRWWVWLVVACAIIAAILVWRRSATAQPANAGGGAPGRVVPVTTAMASQGDIGVYLSALGTVTPVYTVTVTSRVQGEIVKVYYKEGQMVRKGDPLLDIDPRPYEATVLQFEGQLAHDEALLDEAKIDLDRYQQALNRNAIAKQQFDDQQQVVLQNEGTVKNDQGQLANARVNLAYTHLTAPITGQVGLRLVDPGNIIQANSTTPLVVITQLQPITVIFNIAEDHISSIQQQLRKGRKLTVDVFDREESKKLATGSLITVDNMIDTTTGTVKLKAVFPNQDNALFPSQFVNARLLVDTQHGTTLIPTNAIQRNAQGAYVYVIKTDETASIREITTGTTDGNVIAVEGVLPNEVVATNGFDKLQGGAKVAVQQFGDESTSGQTTSSINNEASRASETSGGIRSSGSKPGSSGNSRGSAR